MVQYTVHPLTKLSQIMVLRCRGLSEFWTISDWTELGLVELSSSSLCQPS